MNSDLLQTIKETLKAEIDTLNENAVNEEFLLSLHDATKLLKTSSNRIILTGMGKSGIIARKTAATMTSTGSPAMFLHPADALHGDMGNIQAGEIVLAYSNSGETREIIELLPHIRLLGAKLISVTGKKGSTLANESDLSIIYKLSREGCPLNLAPMASTTICLAIGDALSSALIILKKFKPGDFGKFHPSGALGKKLLTRVKDIMVTNPNNYTVSKQTTFKEILSIMVSSNMGAVLVTGSKGHLRGIITDGDIKRLIDTYESNLEELFMKNAQDYMSADPKSIEPEMLVAEAVSIMHENNTYTLAVINHEKKPVGMVRMHDTIGFI